MLDSDRAKLYSVETKALVQVVKRNRSRFPQHFMFQLTTDRGDTLRSQSVTSKPGRGVADHRPSPDLSPGRVI